MPEPQKNIVSRLVLRAVLARLEMVRRAPRLKTGYYWNVEVVLSRSSQKR